jgi:hypothetical protein
MVKFGLQTDQLFTTHGQVIDMPDIYILCSKGHVDVQNVLKFLRIRNFVEVSLECNCYAP